MLSRASGARWYVVVQDGTDRALAEQACLAILEVVRARTERVCIDAYSDYRDSLTARAQAAQDELRARGALRRRGDPGMAVNLDPTYPPDWELLRAYASWSIHVELDGSEGSLATLHDCGHSISARLSQAEADQLNRAPAGTLRVEALKTPRRHR